MSETSEPRSSAARARDLLDRAAARVEGGYATSELSLGVTRQLVDVARGYLWLAQLEAATARDDWASARATEDQRERDALALYVEDLVSQGIIDRPQRETEERGDGDGKAATPVSRGPRHVYVGPNGEDERATVQAWLDRFNEGVTDRPRPTASDESEEAP